MWSLRPNLHAQQDLEDLLPPTLSVTRAGANRGSFAGILFTLHSTLLDLSPSTCFALSAFRVLLFLLYRITKYLRC